VLGLLEEKRRAGGALLLISTMRKYSTASSTPTICIIWREINPVLLHCFGKNNPVFLQI